MTSRDAILARVRSRLRVDPARLDERRAAVAAHVARHESNPRPAPVHDVVAVFVDRVVKLASTCARVATMAEVPGAVAAYLDGVGLPRRAVCWPALAAEDWADAGVAVEARAARGSDEVGITGAFCGIAETGTLLLLSGADTPGSVSLVPETHVAILDVARIVQGMEDAFALVRAERGTLPRGTVFVSGPSRTADIEQTVTLGVHGPARVHVILVG